MKARTENELSAYYWRTEESHFNNSETMTDYLNVEMDQSWVVLEVDGSYAEIMTDDGKHYEVHARGNGDSFNHAVDFVSLFCESKGRLAEEKAQNDLELSMIGANQ